MSHLKGEPVTLPAAAHLRRLRDFVAKVRGQRLHAMSGREREIGLGECDEMLRAVAAVERQLSQSAGS